MVSVPADEGEYEIVDSHGSIFTQVGHLPKNENGYYGDECDEYSEGDADPPVAIFHLLKILIRRRGGHRSDLKWPKKPVNRTFSYPDQPYPMPGLLEFFGKFELPAREPEGLVVEQEGVDLIAGDHRRSRIIIYHKM